MLRSILGFFTIGMGTAELHLGHFGLFFIITTYDKQPGHPAATGDGAPSFSSFPPSWISLIQDDDDDEYGGDIDDFHSDADRFLPSSLPALSSADFTLSRVQTLR